MRMVSGAGNTDIHAATRDMVGHDAPSGIASLVLAIVVPEPTALHYVAVRRRIVILARVNIDETCRLVDIFDRSVPLDIGRIVKPYVRMRRFESVKLPFPYGRQIGRQAICRHQFIHRIGAVPIRYHPPPIMRQHRIGRVLAGYFRQ